MIRDPSDGSVKHCVCQDQHRRGNCSEETCPYYCGYTTEARPTSSENWGLTSLTQPERKPKPAPTKEQLAEHYARYGLRFQKKEQAE